MKAATTAAAATLAGVLLFGSGTAHAVPPKIDGPATSTLVKKDVTVESEGATLTIDGEEYSTGALRGHLSLLAAECGDAAAVTVLGDAADRLCGESSESEIAWAQADFNLASKVDAAEGTAFGQVRIRMTQTDKGSFDVQLRTETSPSDDALELASKESVEITAEDPEGSSPSVKQFPPVNQKYTLQEPVQLYEPNSSGSSTAEPAGTLDGFDVIVNQSA